MLEVRWQCFPIKEAKWVQLFVVRGKIGEGPDPQEAMEMVKNRATLWAI